MRYIEDLRDKHKGSEIWIIGGGPSLDDFPDDFFDDKLTIALNWSIMIFPRSTYVYWFHSQLSTFAKTASPPLFKKCIMLLPYPFKGESLDAMLAANIVKVKSKNVDVPKEFAKWIANRLVGSEFMEWPIYMKWDVRRVLPHPISLPASQEVYDKIAKGIVEKREVEYHGCHSIAHSAIQAAFILGADKVTLVGCEHRNAPDGKTHSYRGVLYLISWPDYTPNWREISPYKENEEYRKPRAKFLRDHRMGTRWLVKAFKPYGKEIRRYFYNKGYKKIT